MSTENITKINQLLGSQPSGVVMQSFWLAEHGYSLDLQKRYRKSKWLESIGTGAMIRTGDQVGYEGGIYALQNESGSAVHPGGKTALSLLGKAHYLELAANSVTVFDEKGKKLPAWFQKHDWGVKVAYYPTSFLPAGIGLMDMEVKNFSIKISGAARAIMECLYLVPEKQGLVECYELIEGLNNLNPGPIQLLLEKCKSVKVKRLFLYLAERAGHEWFTYLDVNKIDLGKGKRSIVKNGIYVPKYKITVPKELGEYDQAGI